MQTWDKMSSSNLCRPYPHYRGFHQLGIRVSDTTLAAMVIRFPFPFLKKRTYRIGSLNEKWPGETIRQSGITAYLDKRFTPATHFLNTKLAR